MISSAGLSTIFIIIDMVIVTTIVGIALCCYKFQRHKFRRRYDSPPPTLHSVKKMSSEMNMVKNGNYIVTDNTLSPRMMETINKFQQLDNQLSKMNIRYTRQIGQGNFGVVFLGRMTDLLSNYDEDTLVAVKTLKDECLEALEDFAREARIMLQLDHPNIVKLYGVCTDGLPYYLVFEYMDLGDLSKYLRDHASSRQHRLMDHSSCRRSRTESTLSDDPPALSHKVLSDISKQIAAGMEYLAERNYIHNDLACRNCLVRSCPKADDPSSKVIVKIGDFGMSQNLDQHKYYCLQGQVILPICWMSPEVLTSGKFSTASDVWSYGVTMWEVFSFAKQPYDGYSNDKIMTLIQNGEHLKRPTDCPERIYSIMQKCWNMEPEKRPTFTVLQDLIEYCCSSSSSISNSRNIFGSPAHSMDNICEPDVDVFEDTSDGLKEYIPTTHRVDEDHTQGPQA